MRIRKREKTAPIHTRLGDTIALSYHGATVLREKIDREMTTNEAVIFDVEPGEFGDNVKDGIGGAFLVTE